MSRFHAPAQNSLKMTLPLSRSLPALLNQYWYIKRGERVRVRGHAPFYATLGFTMGGDHDVIILGGGHSGLVAAAYLAQAGLSLNDAVEDGERGRLDRSRRRPADGLA